MIWRYVQLKLKPELVDEFLVFTNTHGAMVRHQPGCLSLLLLRDLRDTATFVTWSSWQDEHDLQVYRRSEFFRWFWPQLRAMLREPALAASYTEFRVLL